MPTLINVAEIVIQGTAPTTGSGTKNIFNIFHYVMNTGLTVVAPSAILGQFLSNNWAAIAAQLSIDYTGVASLCRYLDDATVQYTTGAAPANGSIALPRLPLDVSVVTPLRGAQRGKNYRGSKHFGPVPTASVTKDELNSGAVTAWDAVLPYLSGQLVISAVPSLTPIILSRTLSQLRINPTNIVGSAVSAALLNKTIGTMRRRKERTVR